MDCRDLEVFLAVARHLSFTRAGEDVHLSQPSVSVRIRLLQDELGVKLFEQLGKKIVLTEAGQILERHARRIISALGDARQAIQELQGLERGSLRIGASTTPGMYLVPKIIAEFKRQHPKIEIHLDIKDTRQVEDDIVKNEFDFGFVGGHLVGEEVEVIPWLTDEIVLVASPTHPLARKRNTQLKDLAKERFISREQGSATQAAADAALREVSIQLSKVMEINNPESVKRAVESGLGVAFLSKFAIETELKAETLTVVKVKGLRVSRELKIVHHRDKHLSSAAQSLIEMAGRRR
jgi:DNA-binding transcriptional LysR family regulator